MKIASSNIERILKKFKIDDKCTIYQRNDCLLLLYVEYNQNGDELEYKTIKKFEDENFLIVKMVEEDTKYYKITKPY